MRFIKTTSLSLVVEVQFEVLFLYTNRNIASVATVATEVVRQSRNSQLSVHYVEINEAGH